MALMQPRVMGSGHDTSILLDKPPLHLLKVVLDKGDLRVAALSDRGVQVLVEQQVRFSFFGQVPISPHLELVQELEGIGSLTCNS